MGCVNKRVRKMRKENQKILEEFSSLEDPRQEGKKLHMLPEHTKNLVKLKF